MEGCSVKRNVKTLERSLDLPTLYGLLVQEIKDGSKLVLAESVQIL